MNKNPKLPLSDEERLQLRSLKIRIRDIAGMQPEKLADTLGISFFRARKLVALASFQQIPSIGPQLARNIVDLGYFSLDEVKGLEGAQMFDRLEKLYGCQIDPCVEDGLWLIAYVAKSNKMDKSWWDFSEERKAYRSRYGYPEDRPSGHS